MRTFKLVSLLVLIAIVFTACTPAAPYRWDWQHGWRD